MPVKNTEPLFPGQVYHIYNHAIGDENLFRSRPNYLYFLKKYDEYIYPVASTFAYNLMPNHFHLVNRVHNETALLKHYCYLNGISNAEGLKVDYPRFVMQQFSNFLNAYVKAFNKRHDRKGALLI
ncbi:MAG TPA: hypothetical protein PLD84_15115, partial [Chitinophagales bacterium]|nr:hypothetical protein [Chitinophagales bacterium]